MYRVFFGLLAILFFTLPSFSSELYTCTRVIDGDTIQLEDGSRIRYIGINTPELSCPSVI